MKCSLLVNTLKGTATEVYDVGQSYTLPPRQQRFFFPFFFTIDIINTLNKKSIARHSLNYR